MLPSLHAEESMRAAEYLGVGTGSIKPATARSILARWRRDIGREGQRASVAKATPEMLSMMGIGYRVVTKSG